MIDKMHGKDVNPMDTVNKVKGILQKLCYDVVENVRDSKVGVYSTRIDLFCNGTYIGCTNGKGVTVEYALASGYAELMERVTFGTIDGRLHAKIDPKAKSYMDYIYSPDEKLLALDEISGTVMDDLKQRLSKINVPMADLINCFSYNGKSPCIPFYSEITGKTEYVPRDVEYILNGTNGICAGNNKEEALVQGISELFERYAIYRIIKDRITPPSIPEEIYSQVPKVKEVVTTLREKHGLDVVFKDCSLGEGYPVVAVALINKEKQIAKVNMCSAPIFSVAMERTLTEVFQGYTIETLQYSKYYGNMNNGYLNDILQCFRNGTGTYPPEFFGTIPDYPLSVETSFKVLKTNKEYFDYYISFLKEKGMDLYVCNNPYIGFNTYKLIIPGMYEDVFCTSEELNVMMYTTSLGVMSTRIDKLNDEERKQYADISLHLKNKLVVYPYADKYCPMRIKTDNILRKTNSFLLMQALNLYAIKDYTNSYEFMTEYLIPFVNENVYELTMVRCLKDLIYLNKIKGYSEQKTTDILNQFYNDAVIGYIVKLSEDSNELIKYFYNSDPQSKNCYLQHNDYNNYMYFYLKLKEIMAENYKKK